MPRRLIVASALVLTAALSLLLLACGGDEADEDATPTPTTAAAEATATAPAEETPDATPFQGGRDPVEAPAQGQGIPVLTDVRTGEHEGYDRIAFEFDGNERPHYRVEYITGPATGCGSGEPAHIAGTALLQVRFTPANAHDDQGQPTFGSTELLPALTTLLEAEQTCDFEADVAWALGLSQEVDFRVIELDAPPRIAVDVAHPSDRPPPTGP